MAETLTAKTDVTFLGLKNLKILSFAGLGRSGIANVYLAYLNPDTMTKYFLLLLGLASAYAAAAQNVGIGTAIPAATLDVVGNVKITDGTQGAGKLLTSGADGTATWKTPAAAACFFSTQTKPYQILIMLD